MSHELLYILFGALFGLGVAWSVGANDLANVMSTSIGSKAITVKQAILIAVIFEFAGGLLGGQGVARTVSTGIINFASIHDPVILMRGMLAVLLAAAAWLTVASFWGTPVSVTQTIVGSIAGFGAIVLGIHAIHWQQILSILLSWILSPTLAGLLAFLLFQSIQHFIFGTEHPLNSAKRVIPYYLLLLGIILSVMIVLKALHHFSLLPHTKHNFLVVIFCSLLIWVIGQWLLRQINYEPEMPHRLQFIYIERMFALLMVLTAGAMVFAHGSNDVAIAVGPVFSIVAIAKDSIQYSHFTGEFWLIMTFGCLAVVVGFLTYGRKVIMTVGSGITALTPSRAFAATLAAASTVVVSTSSGIPVSATQTLVGAVIGVGLARGIGALDLGVIRNIFLSWMITLPVGAGLTIAFYYVLKNFL
ncbi:MAG: inorganic phosphate transporter [Coxiellaceae bacterium]|nr:MAG: inorganic phosphate transporter [Coxiellaceae bacterium]